MIDNTRPTKRMVSVAVGRLVGNVMGHALIIQADDETIKAELRKRGMWAHVESEVQMGRSWMLSDPTERGVDVFVWLGDPNDYGFMHYHLAGASPASAAYMAFVGSMQGVMKTVDKSAFIAKGGG